MVRFLVGAVMPLAVFWLSKRNVHCVNAVFFVVKEGEMQQNFKCTGFLFIQEDTQHL